MKQLEKLDLVLKALYESTEKTGEIVQLLKERGVDVTLDEAHRLGERLSDAGYVRYSPSRDSAWIDMRSEGIEFVEGDSFTRKSHSIVIKDSDKLKNVYISYAPAQYQEADKIALFLEQEGYDTFFDPRKLVPSDHYDDTIRKAINRCDFFIFLISKASISEGSYAFTELQYCRLRFPNPIGHVLPIIVESLDNNDLPNYLRQINLYQPSKDSVDEVIEVVKEFINTGSVPVQIDENNKYGQLPKEANTGDFSTKYFIAYSNEDTKTVLQLATDLRKANANVWMDKLDISIGVRWDRAVEKALEDCGGMIVVLSPEAVASENVQDEISYALEGEKELVPVLIQPCKIPYRLRRFQYADFTSSRNLAQLLERLR